MQDILRHFIWNLIQQCFFIHLFLFVGKQYYCLHMARYVHFDVKASRRSRKQIQPISSEKIEICLVRFKSISSREHIHYFRKPREMGLFRESSWPIVSTLICSASAWDFIASTLIPSMTEFVFFPASTWTRIITTYLFRPVCSFLNHKWYFAIIHK